MSKHLLKIHDKILFFQINLILLVIDLRRLQMLQVLFSLGLLLLALECSKCVYYE